VKINRNDSKNGIFATLWIATGLGSLLGGVAFWTAVAASTFVAGTYALVIFASIVLTSAFGIGSIVGYCTKKALENYQLYCRTII
jgi:hypothetical protein